MQYIGFISIDKTANWYKYSTHHGPSVYHTPKFNSRDEAESYIKKLISLHPDNNIEIKDGKLHDFNIHYVIFRMDEGSFNTLRSMTSALDADWYKTTILGVKEDNHGNI